MKTILGLFTLWLCVGWASATTYFVRSDGGVRYSAAGGGNTLFGGCNGTADVSAASVGLTSQIIWSSTTVYPANTTILGNNGHYQHTTAGGTSGSTPPTWPMASDGTITDWVQGAVASTNLNCAFNDFRYLYDDQRYNAIVVGWLPVGGDRVVVRSCFNPNSNLDGSTQCRIGSNAPGKFDDWCTGVSGGSQGCSSGPIPSGSIGAHTKILGSCAYDATPGPCNTGNTTNFANLTQLFGGNGLGTVINLQSVAYLDFQGIEITRHSQCIGAGSPPIPAQCVRGTDDYVDLGIATNPTTTNLLLQDVWVHGMTNTGVRGAFDSVLTTTRVTVNFNGQAGWNFDDGSSTPTGTTAQWNITYSDISWNGCNQEYPITHTYPAISCYGQSNQGYGDGVGTPPGECFNVNMSHNTFSHNTQDGVDFGHFNTVNRTDGHCVVNMTQNAGWANSGQQFKWGPAPTTTVFENNIIVANCKRMAYPITGTPATYNANLGDFCRAGDAISFNFFAGSQLTFAGNTLVTYAPVTYDVACNDISGFCTGALWTMKNNLNLAYSNTPAGFAYNGNGAPPGYCGPGCNSSTQPWPTQAWSNNLYYQLFTPVCPTGFANDICVNPTLTSQPVGNSGSFVEAQLDIYIPGASAWTPLMGSPVIAAGVAVAGLTTDYYGTARPNPPSIGAVELSSGGTGTFPIGGSILLGGSLLIQ